MNPRDINNLRRMNTKAQIYMLITIFVGLICTAIIGITFDNYMGKGLFLNLMFVQIFVLIAFEILTILVAIKPNTGKVMMIISCTMQIILTIIIVPILSIKAKQIDNVRIQTGSIIIQSYNQLNNGRGRISGKPYFDIIYSFNIDNYSNVRITLSQTMDGKVNKIIYCVESSHRYSIDGYNQYTKPTIDTIQNALYELQSNLNKDSRLYEELIICSYLPTISNEAKELYNEGRVDSYSNSDRLKMENNKKLYTYERMENKDNNNFYYYYSVECKD